MRGLILILIVLITFPSCEERPTGSKKEQAWRAYCKCIYGRHKLKKVNAEKILKDFEKGMIESGNITSTNADGFRAFLEHIKESNSISVKGKNYGMNELDLSIFTNCRYEILYPEHLVSKEMQQQIDAIVQTIGSLDQLSPGLVAEVMLRYVDDDLMNEKYMRMQFLLMLYTVLDQDEGISEKLPPKVKDEPEVANPKNVLTVDLNAENEIRIEGFPVTGVEDINTYLYNFYNNPESLSQFPVREMVNRNRCELERKTILESSSDEELKQLRLDKLEQKIAALELLGGSYYELPDDALIELFVEKGTNYAVYIQLQDEIKKGLNTLRDNFCQKTFGKKFSALNPEKEEDKPYISAVQLVYPLKIAEATSDR